MKKSFWLAVMIIIFISASVSAKYDGTYTLSDLPIIFIDLMLTMFISLAQGFIKQIFPLVNIGPSPEDLALLALGLVFTVFGAIITLAFGLIKFAQKINSNRNNPYRRMYGRF